MPFEMFRECTDRVFAGSVREIFGSGHLQNRLFWRGQGLPYRLHIRLQTFFGAQELLLWLKIEFTKTTNEVLKHRGAPKFCMAASYFTIFKGFFLNRTSTHIDSL